MPRWPSSIRYSFPSRSSSRSISSRRASCSYIGLSILAIFVIPSRRALLIGSCSFRLIVRRHYRHINIIPYIHRILVSLYSCIFYIHRIHHIHYIHPSTRHDEPRHNIQASSRRPASRPVRLKSDKRHEARAIATGNEKQATMNQNGERR